MALTINYLKARHKTIEQIKCLRIETAIYQGTVNVTEHINFQDIGKEFELTVAEYENLIKEAQVTTDLALKRLYKIN